MHYVVLQKLLMNVRVNHVKMAGHATFVMMVTFAPVLMDMAVMSVNVNLFLSCKILTYMHSFSKTCFCRKH